MKPTYFRSMVKTGLVEHMMFYTDIPVKSHMPIANDYLDSLDVAGDMPESDVQGYVDKGIGYIAGLLKNGEYEV